MSPPLKALVLTGITLSIYSLVRLALYLKYRELFRDASRLGVLYAFVRGLRFDISALLTFFAAPLVMFLLPFPFAAEPVWQALWGWTMYALTVVMTLILVGDLFYFGDVQRHLANELSLLGNDLADIGAMVLGAYRIPFVLYVGAMSGLGWVWARILALPSGPLEYGIIAFLAAGPLLFLGIRGTTKGKSINIIDAFQKGDPMLGNLALNGVFTAYHATRSTQNLNHEFMDHAEAVRVLFRDREVIDRDYLFMRRFADAEPTGRNVVFVLLESWSSKYLDSFAGSGVGVTPNFDRVAERGVRFPRFYAAGQRSINAIQAILAGTPILPGLPPVGFGLESSNVLQLGKLVKRHGYHTLFVKSSKRRSFRVDAIADAAGFDDYYGWEDMPMRLAYPDPHSSRFGWDYETLMFFKEKLDQARRPFFGFTFTGVTHIPYSYLGERFSVRPHAADTEEGFLNTLYYADWSLGEFFSAARESEWFEDTIFVMTSDTTLGMFQSGSFPERFHIPLVIYAPGILEPRCIEAVSSQLDILPTLIELLGFDDPFAALGGSLFRRPNGYAFIEQGGLLGLIASDGWLVHGLERRLDARGFNGELPRERANELERLLLAIDQLTYRQLRANRWVRG